MLAELLWRRLHRDQSQLNFAARTGRGNPPIQSHYSPIRYRHSNFPLSSQAEVNQTSISYAILVLFRMQMMHTNKVRDLGLLSETAGAARETRGVEKIGAAAGLGYFKIEDIETCEAAVIVPYVPKQRGSAVLPPPSRRRRCRAQAQHAVHRARQASADGHTWSAPLSH